MKKRFLITIWILLAIMVFAGCQRKSEAPDIASPAPTPFVVVSDSSNSREMQTPEIAHDMSFSPEATSEQLPSEKVLNLEPYFQGINGCAVFYRPSRLEYLSYNESLCDLPSSPCSTFKIISSLIGLHEGAIVLNDTLLPWSGEKFWNEKWNHDMEFREAFQTSCVWYYREILNQVGEASVKESLERLGYGNADVSDWEGRLNTNNSNRALTGFWIESSLKVSPRQQAEVLAGIFESGSFFTPEHISAVKDVMWIESGKDAIALYGKTGMGMKGKQCLDAWFVGLFEKDGDMVTFAIRLDDPDNPSVTSQKAKEIAIAIILGEGLE